MVLSLGFVGLLRSFRLWGRIFGLWGIGKLRVSLSTLNLKAP